MEGSRSRQILIAGAGIAGLTAALAFAARGFSVQVHERAQRLEEVGAGLQLSPNATRLLGRLGVLPLLMSASVRPEAVVLKKASTLAELARVPLGDAAESRWHAPYVVVHRADLQSALLSRVSQDADIKLLSGATVRDFATHGGGVTVSVDTGGRVSDVSGALLVGADGVWSTLRGRTRQDAASRFSGEVAWRTTILASSMAGAAFREVGGFDIVTALLNPGFHLVAYPVRAGAAVNLAAFTPGQEMSEGWSTKLDPAPLRDAMRRTHPALSGLIEAAGPWTAWPIHTVSPEPAWLSGGRVALIGDAAHALTPFAAQGAAMAIEDAVTLADAFADKPWDVTVLPAWEAARKARIRQVARRGAFNRLAWHAAGPIALARDMILKRRPPAQLAADLDWLYGWEPAAPR